MLRLGCEEAHEIEVRLAPRDDRDDAGAVAAGIGEAWFATDVFLGLVDWLGVRDAVWNWLLEAA